MLIYDKNLYCAQNFVIKKIKAKSLNIFLTGGSGAAWKRRLQLLMLCAVLWIRIQIGSVIRFFVDPWIQDQVPRLSQCCGAGAVKKGAAPAPAQGPAMTPCLKKREQK